MENSRPDTRIMLASGHLFDVLNPAASNVLLSDIAHGLGRVCRFGGQSNRYYSVAEHCCNVARLVPLHLGRAALMHDGAEAIIGDVVRPLKGLLPEYRVIEAKIEAELAQRFGTPNADARCMGTPLAIKDPAIKLADNAMCAAEAMELMPADPAYWSGIGADPEMFARARRLRLQFDRPEFASAAWLRMWHWFGHREQCATGETPLEGQAA